MRHIFGQKPWKNYRLWLLVLFSSYTLFGFLLLPYVLKAQLIKYVDATLQQKASLEAVHFNPFLLRLRLQNLHLATPEQAPLLTLGQLVVDFDTFGLFKGAWQFSDISLTEIAVFAEIDGTGKLNLNALIPPAGNDPATQQKASPDETTGSPLPRLILQNIAINQGQVHFKQLNRAEPFSLNLNPLNFNVANFSTLQEDGGQFSFNAKFSNSETLAFSGQLQLEPLVLNGHIALDNIELSRGSDYLAEVLLFSIDEGKLSINSDFSLDKRGPTKSLALQASNIGVAIHQLQLGTLKPIEPLLNLNSLVLNNGSFAWPEQSISADSLVIDNGAVHSWLTAEKVFNYSQLVKPAAVPQPGLDNAASNAVKPWLLHLEQVQLSALQLSFDDRTLGEPARQTVEITDFSLRPFTLEQGAEFDLQAHLNINQSGKGTIAGKIGATPPTAALTIELNGVPLPSINNYLHDTIRLNFTDGHVDADLQLDYNKSLALRGDINIRQLDTFDLADQESWVNWQNLSIKALDLQLEPASLNIASVELVQPYVDTVIFDNGETRLSRMLVHAAEQSTGEDTNKLPQPDASKNTKEDSNFPITIAEFKLIDGSMDFKDFNLPLDFATHIHNLNGQASDLSTNSENPAEFIFNGKIDQHGSANINATSLLSSPHEFSEITLNFNNVDIISASSYSGKFAGYAIDAGILSLNLDYRIKQGQMLGDNQIFLKQLTLGDAVESPDAVSLPLKLAVALMKDVNGNIDIDLPVEGDLNSPEVRISGIVWKAFTNLLIKVAASPFTVLGSLFETGDNSGLESVAFTPGSSELSAKEQEDLKKLAQGLQLKSQLALTINACYDPEADRIALQTFQVNAAYNALAAGASSNSVETSVAPPSYQNQFLKEMYLATFGKAQLAQLETASKQAITSQASNEQSSISLLSSVEVLVNEQILQRLISTQVLGATAIIDLANRRARSISEYMTGLAEGEALAQSRLRSSDQPMTVRGDSNVISCPLTLSAL